jgi:hypothetical protein
MRIHPTLVESKNVEKINVENTGEKFLALTLKSLQKSQLEENDFYLKSYIKHSIDFI